MTAAPRPRIALLPPEVAARIAAGEVIERPASVVKELIENALDAGATHVEVEVAGGGVDQIRVRDDGCGIPPDQVADAFERHATSKLRSEHDLFAVRTLGFRGEALASIAAAADVDLVTRPAEQEAAAVARLRDGRLERLGSAAGAPGTSVEARDLFAALPARRRFLRTPRAET
ncbi:MAG: DNA mismatch repair endonuclease MutL, partial [Dehalococcoidia bacterium]